MNIIKTIAFGCELALFAGALHLSVSPAHPPAASTTVIMVASADQALPTVTVERIPAAVVLYRDVVGPYSQHPVVLRELMEYVGKNYRAVGACFGIYPNDPDAFKAGNLRWQVGVRVIKGDPLGFGNNLPISTLKPSSPAQLLRALSKLDPPSKPYKLKVLDPAEGAVVESTVARAPQDGLAMFPWMAENGYVQIAPTRMDYLSHEGAPESIKVRIIVPVRKRPTGLKLSQ